MMILGLDNFKKRSMISWAIRLEMNYLLKYLCVLKQPFPTTLAYIVLEVMNSAYLVDNNSDIFSSAVIANNVIDAFATTFELISEKVVVGLSIGDILISGV